MAENPIAGKSFVFTGTLASITRKEAEAAISESGGSVAGDVSGRTDVLVAGDKPGGRVAKAEKLGIPVWSEAQLVEALRNAGVSTAPPTGTMSDSPSAAHFAVRVLKRFKIEELCKAITLLDSGEDLWERGWEDGKDSLFWPGRERDGVACEVIDHSSGECVGLLFIVTGGWVNWRGTGYEYLDWQLGATVGADLPIQLVFDPRIASDLDQKTLAVSGGLVWTVEPDNRYADEVESTAAVPGKYVTSEIEVPDLPDDHDAFDDEFRFTDDYDPVTGPYLVILESHYKQFLEFIKTAC